MALGETTAQFVGSEVVGKVSLCKSLIRYLCKWELSVVHGLFPFRFTLLYRLFLRVAEQSKLMDPITVQLLMNKFNPAFLQTETYYASLWIYL